MEKSLHLIKVDVDCQGLLFGHFLKGKISYRQSFLMMFSNCVEFKSWVGGAIVNVGGRRNRVLLLLVSWNVGN